MKALPLPPLAREAELVDGWLWIYASPKAWTLVGRGDDCRAVIFPMNRPAGTYRWPVAGLKVIVIGHNRSPADLTDLVACLLVAGATEVWLQHDSLQEPERYTSADFSRSGA